MKLLLRQQALLILVAGVIFFVSLGGSALFNDGEARNAATSAEMLRTQAWIVPTFNGSPRTDAPILSNWLMSLTLRFGGSPELLARLPSALAALATILVTYHLGRKLYSTDIGFLAGLILATFLLFAASARSATSSSLTILLVTWSMTSYVWQVTRQRGANFCRNLSRNQPAPPPAAVEVPADQTGEDSPPPKRLLPKIDLIRALKVAAPIYLPLGLVVLADGPLACLLTCAALLVFHVVSQRLDDLDNGKLFVYVGPKWRGWVVGLAQHFRPRPILAACHEIHLFGGLAIIGLIALPWYLAVAASTRGAWTKSFLLDQHFGPLFNVLDGNNGFPFFVLYPAVMIHFGCYPWSVFLPVAISRLRDRLIEGAPWRESDRLLSCWLGVWLFVFSLSATKDTAALLPVYPAVALILARHFNDWKRGTGSQGIYSISICCRALWITGILLVLGLAMMAYLYFPPEQWMGICGLAPIIGALVAGRFLDRDKRLQVLRTFQATAFVLVILCVIVIPWRMRPYQDSPLFIQDARQKAKTENVDFGTYNYFEPSLVFYSGKNVQALTSPREVADFLAGHANGFVITPEKKYNELRNDLSVTTMELSRHRNFLHGRELILIGRF